MSKKRLITSVLIIAVMLISFLGGNTFAKYITSSKSTATLQVAKWSVNESFLVNGNSTTSANVNLFNSYDAKTLVNGKIAPGTSGTFGIKIDTTGTETGVDYKIKFSNISSTQITNLIYLYNKIYYYSLSDLEKDLSGTITADAKEKAVTLSIKWIWPYETPDATNSIIEGDKNDTSVGQNASKFSFDVNITCTQVTPKAV